MRVHNVSASPNRRGQLLLAALMLVVAVLAWAGIDSRGVRATEPAPSSPAMQQVVIVHRDISPARDVVAEDVRVELRAAETVPHGAVRDPQLLIGRRPVAHLGVGMPLTMSLVATNEPQPAVVAPPTVPVLPVAHGVTPVVHDVAPPPVAAQVESRAKGRGFASYVWVNGAPLAFGVDESGALHVVDRLGNVMPLDSGSTRSTDGR